MHISDMVEELTTFAAWRDAQKSFGCSSKLDVYADWVVAPCGRHRESDCLSESNFAVALKTLGGESDTVAVLRFGHWAVGWSEIIVAHPSHGAAVAEMTAALDGYPVLDDTDFSEREQQAADDVWKGCFNNSERLEYIRKHRSQFEFHCLSDMLDCVRGNYFAGYASELLG